ncbi:sialidase family protein [Akkermansia glycaniphila]|uniref:Sialidases n=1 Tax=Akkermansia glycaniphila TaxID=1679444 RepID=A0A1H6MQ58_9BACT|nr:sialidase family protein [Akkermansia glycaniphila]SEI00063.1 sialidases [Akkermansia glycaniphila]
MTTMHNQFNRNVPFSLLLASLAAVASLPAAWAAAPEPAVVATPPSDGSRGLIRIGPKEIRHYSGDRGNGPLNMLVSRDNGQTWQKTKTPQAYPPNFGGIPIESPAITWLPKQKMFIRVQPINGFVFMSKKIDGPWSAVTKDGKLEPKWEDKEKQKNFVKLGGIMRNPLAVDKGRRIIIPAHDKSKGTWFHISDDGGLTWRTSKGRITVGKYTPSSRDKGARWHNGGVEATVVELKDGRLWALVRTAHDQHWQSYSKDKGETWSDPEPSRFFGTLTMITVGRLENGKLYATWTNTAALPEVNHGRNDAWEDVFTNRDSHHIALSDDDGKTWYGFREIYLNSHRNDANYGDMPGTDRGSHQSEVVDLGKGKILVSLGQHPEHRRMVIVDENWISENTRNSNITKTGLDEWTAHTYLPVIKKHCAYNRKPSATVERHPDKGGAKVISLRFMDDDTLVNQQTGADYRAGGATWNIPNLGFAGRAATRIRFPKDSGGVHLSLCDRLFNACDTTTPEQALFTVKLAPGDKIGNITLKPDTWYTVEFNWNIDNETKSAKKQGTCTLSIDGAKAETLKQLNPSPNGISYIHYISAAPAPDSGVLIEGVGCKPAGADSKQ